MDHWKRYRLPEANRRKCLKKFFYVPGIILICLLPLVLIGCQNGGTSTPNLTVLMTSNPMQMNGQFSPRELQITVGQTVIWKNTSSIHHTVTADDDSFHSGYVEPGASYSHAFLRPGRYPYHCVLHGSELGAGMAGVIIVDPASSSTATSPNDQETQTLSLS